MAGLKLGQARQPFLRSLKGLSSSHAAGFLQEFSTGIVWKAIGVDFRPTSEAIG
jgi:hypothetical protein